MKLTNKNPEVLAKLNEWENLTVKLVVTEPVYFAVTGTLVKHSGPTDDTIVFSVHVPGNPQEFCFTYEVVRNLYWNSEPTLTRSIYC